MEILFLRDTDTREVDFVVTKDNVPLFAVECKTGAKAISPAVRYFSERTTFPKFYQTYLGEQHFESGDISVLPFKTLYDTLGLP